METGGRAALTLSQGSASVKLTSHWPLLAVVRIYVHKYLHSSRAPTALSENCKSFQLKWRSGVQGCQLGYFLARSGFSSSRHLVTPNKQGRK